MSAEATYHALLIGIDAYRGADSLFGAVNDIDAIQGLLRERLGVPPARIRRLVAPRHGARPRDDVPSEAPTRANVLAALQALASDAVRTGDRVFIYYSGHGTQLAVVGEGGRQYTQEALLPADHAQPDPATGRPIRRYLFDWELNAALRAITARTPCVSVVLDACCSHGATRDLGEGARGRDRFVESREPYVLQDMTEPPCSRGIAGALTGGGQALVVAACLADERARELDDDGDRPAHGALTRALLEQLARLPDAELAELRWGRIWRATVAALERMNPLQHPWISSGHARRVFGGPPEDADLGYGVLQGGASYRLDAGALSGVTEGAAVAVYPPTPAKFPPLGSPEDAAARLVQLRITRADRTSASAVATSPNPPGELPPGARGRLIAAGEPARLRVAITPHDAALADRLAASGLLSFVAAGETGDVALVQRRDGRWALTDDVFGAGEDDEPALPAIAGGDVEPVARFVEHYFHYAAPRRLAKQCQDLPQGLDVRLLDCGAVAPRLAGTEAQDPRLPELPRGRRADYELRATLPERAGDRYCIRVENTTDARLHVTVLASDSDGRVHVLADREDLRPGFRKVVWFPGELGVPFEARLAPGQRLGVDQFVVVGTTSAGADLGHLAVDASFADALAGSSKAFGPAGGAPVDRWTATLVTVRTTA